MTEQKADIAVIGLAVMGENLILNMESKGLTVACYNRTVSKVDDFINGRARGKNIIGCHTLEELVLTLKSPRKVMLMVKAGKPVDIFIDRLLGLLADGDVIIDGGNSYFIDTIARCEKVEQAGKLYIGTGVSGGEQGALKGPSLMPGGSPAAWALVKDIFQTIAAHTDSGEACCEWVGPQGAGHFVKMVHNGIEYGDIQLICESYQMMRDSLGMTNQQMHEVFARWNEGVLDSYLIEITRDILAYKDEQGNEVLDLILDTAGQKGTGKWTAITALEQGVPLTLIAEAVYARCLSAIKDQRLSASKKLTGPDMRYTGAKDAMLSDMELALYGAKIISYAQGYQLMRAAAEHYGWDLNYGGIALMWRGGCIIRSAFLDKIKAAFTRQPDLVNLLLDDFFCKELARVEPSLRRVLSAAIATGLPVPAMSAALAYYDGYRCGRLGANMLQAQRDYFGAHTYERLDKPRGKFFHTNWTGHGGTTASTTYTA